METAKLLVIDTDRKWTIDVDASPFTIGRDQHNRLQITRRSNVSRKHAEIILDHNRFRLHDCHSRFGTYKNGERVEDVLLSDHDRINLGSLDPPQLVFLHDEKVDTAQTTIHHGEASATGDFRMLSRVLEDLRLMGTSSVLADILDRATDDAIELADADRGFIMLLDTKGVLDFRVARGRGRVKLSRGGYEISRKIPEQVVATGRSQFHSDLDQPGLSEEHEQTRDLGVHAVACVPLRLLHLSDTEEEDSREAEVIGVLYVDSRRSRQAVTPVVIMALEALGAQAAVAMENAELYREARQKELLESDLRLASRIQRQLLPSEGLTGAFYEAAGFSLPCRMVGGDLFDHLQLPDGTLGVALADVAGKGSAAALLAALLHGTFMILALNTPAPSQTLTELNRVLVRRNLRAGFVTFHYAKIWPDGRLISCNAGHNYPMIVRQNGTIEYLVEGGIPLGIFETIVYENETAQLEPGDSLLTFSDGLVGTLNRIGEEMDEERILECVSRNRDRPVHEMLGCMLNSVDCFVREGPQADDLTALMVRYRPM
jgi:serine phosphatase RsbU (regulator of sigma subunit)